MGDVSVTYQIMPESVNVDLKKLQEKIRERMPENVRIMGFQVKPVAFGLQVLLMNVIMPDEEGGADKVQDILEALEEVNTVDVVDLTLV